MRALGAYFDGSDTGVFTDRPGTLTNDFFVNLMAMNTVWSPVGEDEQMFEGHDRTSGQKLWNASRVDLVFGSNSQLRALAEVFAAEHEAERFVGRFVKAWSKVMNADRFDVK